MTKAAHLLAGENAEQAACDFLLAKQIKLIERNVRYPFGEIDLLMQDGKELVFVEVRFRRNQKFGGGAESVTLSKQKKKWQTRHKPGFRATSNGRTRRAASTSSLWIGIKMHSESTG